MTLWVKLDYKNFDPHDGLEAEHFTDIASVKRWFREEKNTDYSVVKYNGKLMKDAAPVPKTTKDNCLHLLREIHIFVYDIKSGNKKHQEEKGRATQKFSEIRPRKENEILLYKGEYFPFDSELHKFETTTNDRLLVVFTISVEYKIHFAQDVKNDQIEINGDAMVADLISHVCGFHSIDTHKLKEYFSVTCNGEEISEKTRYVAEYGWPHWDKQFVIRYEPDVYNKIEIMKYFTQSPTKNENKKLETRKYRREKLNLLTPIYDHREGRVGDDITLYYQGFKRFIDDTDKVMPNKEDCDFVQKMCHEMAKYCENEKLKERTFKSLTEKYFDVHMVPSAAGKSMCDLTINPCECVQVEIKKEIYEISVDSYTQIIGYYVHSLRGRGEINEVDKKDVDRCPAPGFLLELIGPHLFISGAVYGKYVFVDRLVDPVWLVPQNQKAMIRIARIFKALKDAIRAIRSYYTVLPPLPQYQPDQPHQNQIRHPTVTLHKVDDETAEISIIYIKRIQANMFKGKTPESPDHENLIIHFVENYNQDVHNLMHKNGLAPKIVEYTRAKDTHYMAIIMEHTCEVTSFADYLNTGPDRSQKEAIFKECEKVLATMHREGLCHGNFTHESILIQQQQQGKKIFVVNFQFSGKFREERHGMIITPEGDDASLLQIKELLQIQ